MELDGSNGAAAGLSSECVSLLLWSHNAAVEAGLIPAEQVEQRNGLPATFTSCLFNR